MYVVWNSQFMRNYMNANILRSVSSVTRKWCDFWSALRILTRWLSALTTVSKDFDDIENCVTGARRIWQVSRSLPNCKTKPEQWRAELHANDNWWVMRRRRSKMLYGNIYTCVFRKIPKDDQGFLFYFKMIHLNLVLWNLLNWNVNMSTTYDEPLYVFLYRRQCLSNTGCVWINGCASSHLTKINQCDFGIRRCLHLIVRGTPELLNNKRNTLNK
jgi:hypothetical protein